MRQKTPHSIKGWSVSGVLLESHCYAPGAAFVAPRHAHEEYQFGLSLTNVGGYQLSRRKAYAAPDRVPSPLSILASRTMLAATDRDAPSLHRMMYVPIADRLRQAQVQAWGERALGWPLPFFPDPILVDAIAI